MRAATEAFRAGARRVRCRGRLDKVASARIEIVRVLIVAEQDGVGRPDRADGSALAPFAWDRRRAP